MRTSLKILLSSTCTLLLALALATPALAEDGGRRGKGHRHGHKACKLFERFDKDGSGSLTSDEVPARLWKRISKADADGDGAVTKAELKAAHKKCKGKRGGKRDS